MPDKLDKAEIMKKMVHKFQCPGCAAGTDPETCPQYKFTAEHLRCVNHVIGTMLGLWNPVALGLPKGFNKPAYRIDGSRESKMAIRLFLKGEKPVWDRLNVPVWVLEKDGYLFVRTYAPRIDFSWVDVIEGGKAEDTWPWEAINVAEFYDTID